MRALSWFLIVGGGLLWAGCGGKENADLPSSPATGGAGGAQDGGTGGTGGSTAGAGGTAGTGGTAGLGGSGGVDVDGSAGQAGDGGSAGSGGLGGSGGAGGAGGSAGGGGTGGTGGGPHPNAGTEFWAVDLPNARGMDTASQDPWGVAISNLSSSPATVTIELNQAGPGNPPSLQTVQSLTVAAGGSTIVQMPTREVTGPVVSEPPGPQMTWLSSNAFRITSDQPVAVVQMNPLADSSSNDTALLLPQQGLGMDYYVVGYPTANPVSYGPAIAGIPDHSSLTIVGSEAGTTVTVVPTAALLGSGGNVLPTPAGATLSMQLGPFDVLNLATDGAPGDLTGTHVTATKPVAVFTSGERAIVPTGADQPPAPPGYSGDNCCTDHLEAQLWPTGSLGHTWVIPHSPPRSSGGYIERDLIRFVGTADGTSVTTTLPAPMNSFVLGKGEVRDAWVAGDLAVEATAQIVVGQILVSKGFTTSNTGDPSLTLIPPTLHYRASATFHVPTTFDKNYVVIVAPLGASLQLDGAAMPASCASDPPVAAGGSSYEVVRCEVPEGGHRLTGSAAFGSLVYGYGVASSYAFPAAGN